MVTRFCRQCGAAIAPYTRFCRQCGMTTMHSSQNGQVQPKEHIIMRLDHVMDKPWVRLKNRAPDRYATSYQSFTFFFTNRKILLLPTLNDDIDQWLTNQQPRSEQGVASKAADWLIIPMGAYKKGAQSGELMRNRRLLKEEMERRLGAMTIDELESSAIRSIKAEEIKQLRIKRGSRLRSPEVTIVTTHDELKFACHFSPGYLDEHITQLKHDMGLDKKIIVEG